MWNVNIFAHTLTHHTHAHTHTVSLSPDVRKHENIFFFCKMPSVQKRNRRKIKKLYTTFPKELRRIYSATKSLKIFPTIAVKWIDQKIVDIVMCWYTEPDWNSFRVSVVHKIKSVTSTPTQKTAAAEVPFYNKNQQWVSSDCTVVCSTTKLENYLSSKC